MLAKAISRNALDHGMTAEDAGLMLGFLHQYGDLNDELKYQAPTRAGFIIELLHQRAQADA